MNLAKVGETPLAGLETSLRRWITGLAHELQGITDAAHRVVVPDEYIETLVGLRAPFDLHRRLGRVGRVKRSDRNHLIEFHAEGAFVGERERNEATTFHSYARDPAAPHETRPRLCDGCAAGQHVLDEFRSTRHGSWRGRHRLLSRHGRGAAERKCADQ